MKTFENFISQGDVLFRRVQELPENLKQVDHVIVAHSETGHHHSFRKDSGVTLYESSDPFTCYLRCEAPLAELEHHRPWDTHESIGFTPGLYMVRRQREHTPEGWRMVQD